MKEHLSLEYTEHQDGIYTAQITHQTNRGPKFNKGSYVFRATNGIQLASLWSPCFATDMGISTLYVRRIPAFDLNPIFITSIAFVDRIKLAVREYNQVTNL